MKKILWVDPDPDHLAHMQGLVWGLLLYQYMVGIVCEANEGLIVKEAHDVDVAIIHPGTFQDTCDIVAIAKALRTECPNVKIGLLTNTSRHGVNPDFIVTMPIRPTKLISKIESALEN